MAFWDGMCEEPSEMKTVTECRVGNVSLGLVLLSVSQEPRQGPSVPDLSGVHPGHAHRRGSLPVAEEGAEPADDRRVPWQQQEALQQRRPGVSSLDSE